MIFESVGAACFGIVIGWITYRTLRRRAQAAQLSDIASVVAAVGGGAVALLFGAQLFAWYSIGLAVGFFAYLVLANTVFKEEVSWLGGEDHYWLDSVVLKKRAGGLDTADLEEILKRLEPASGDLTAQWPGPLASTKPPRAARPSAEAVPAKHAPRYANAALFDIAGERALSASSPMEPGQRVRLRLDIGELSPESHVKHPVPFPDEKLPEDVDLDVMVSSTDFIVASSKDGLRKKRSTAAHGSFFLPGNGRPAVAPDGGAYLWFYLKAPQPQGRARCRIGYYYKGILVQSQLLVAPVGLSGVLEITTDFTVSDDLTNFRAFPPRPRISVLTNANGDGTHQLVLRRPGSRPAAPAEGESFYVREENIGDTITSLREVLRDHAPTEVRRTPRELRADLALLAPLGRKLWSQTAAQHVQMFRPLFKDPGSYVIQVCRPTSSGFVFPWSLIYDFPLSDDPTTCKLVEDWNGEAPLVTGLPRECPYGPHTDGAYCPFGFWGFRYSIDQLASTESSVFDIVAPEGCDFSVAETQYKVDTDALSGHVKELKSIVSRKFPHSELKEGQDKTSIKALLSHDLPLVYFYCHGERQRSGDANTYLGVGKRESIKATEFQDWVQTWAIEDKVVWNQTRPLIFINACHSAEIHPETLVSYLDAFVGTGRAAGVVGTEVRINQYLAMDFAQRFFELLLAEQKTVDEALRSVRLKYLADGNLFGLAYTQYCWSELTIKPAA